MQTAMLAYKLWGGSVNPGIPGLGGNMYAYSGPRNMKACSSLVSSVAAFIHLFFFLNGFSSLLIRYLFGMLCWSGLIGL